MFQSIWDDVKREFQHGNMVTRLIIANIAFFLLINIGKLILKIPFGAETVRFTTLLHFFCFSSDWKFLLTHPWTIITSMFLHEDFSHIFWNMVTFYWFGRIVGDLLGNHRILPIYILGGLVGSLVFFVVSNLHLVGLGYQGEFALGASAAVMAMMACAVTIAPDYIFNVLFVGPVKLKYIALVMIFLDLVGIADRENTGGHLAHLGGVAFGFIYATQLQRGNDIGKFLTSFITTFQNFFRPKPKSRMTFERGERAYAERGQKQSKTNKKGENTEGSSATDTQARVDEILDKIKQNSYDSLTKEEKEFLFNASKK
jgi:membrane associated rhomboid family serine protease